MVAAGMAVVLSFFPYLVIPLGGSTSISIGALVGLVAWVLGPRYSSLDLAVVVIGMLPILAMAMSTLLFDTPLPQTAAITWLGAVGPFAAGAMAVVSLQRRLASLLGWLILGSSLFGILQHFAIQSGFIPFLELYRAPGYASVEANAQTILLYIRRPFAQFPEPSFMAGSIALAILAMLLVSRFSGQPRLGRLELIALMTGSITIVLSESGSAVIGLGAIAVALLASSARTVGAQARAALTITLAVMGAVWVLDQRSSPLNFSWGDRLASIQAAAQHWLSEAPSFLFGLGRGGMTAAFTQGRIDLAGFNFTQAPPDVFSALGRILFESGVLAGGAVLLLLAVTIVRAGAAIAPMFGVAMLAAWGVVAGITISYESAAMIWLLPGVCLAVVVARRRDIVA